MTPSDVIELAGVSRPDRVRVVHLSSGHRAGESRIFRKECRSLARAGYDVTYVCRGDPHFTPDGADMVQDGVRILTVKRRAGRLGRMVVTPLEIVMVGLRQGGTLYHFHDPELIPLGLILRLLGKRVIYDVHEDVPRDVLVKEWIPRILRQPVSLAMALVEWIAARTLSGLVAATPAIARRFPKDSVALVQNFAFTSELVQDGVPVGERRAVTYVGAMSTDRCAIEMVEAIARVQRNPDIRLIIAGTAHPPSLIEELSSMAGWSRVDYRGLLDRDGVRGVLAESRVGLVFFRPVQCYLEAQPTKLFEYMAAGLAVIAADFPRWREIVEENGCGLCVPPGDVAAIASAIEWMFEHPAEAHEMGRRGRQIVVNSLNWEREAQELLRLYARVIGAGHCQDRVAN